MKRQFKPLKFVGFIELSDDVDELLELFSQAESLNVRAENELKLRRSERALIKDRLKVVRQNHDTPHITDHAVVRYLERVVGVDIEACKKEMLSKLPEDFKQSPEIEFVNITNEGLRYVIRDNLIISVTPTNSAEDLHDTQDKVRANYKAIRKLAKGTLPERGKDV